MKTKIAREIILVLIGFGLIYAGMTSSILSLLTWIGIWVLIATVLWYYNKMGHEAEKEGKLVLF